VNANTFTGNREIPGVGVKSMWYRGTGTVKMELTDAGRDILGDMPGLIEVRYANGPILSPAGKEDLPSYVPLAFFRTEISLWEPQEGTMVNTPAIVESEFGEGRVIAISPHPESKAGLESLVQRAVTWVAGSLSPVCWPWLAFECVCETAALHVSGVSIIPARPWAVHTCTIRPSCRPRTRQSQWCHIVHQSTIRQVSLHPETIVPTVSSTVSVRGG
jgi:hypothetical protein